MMACVLVYTGGDIGIHSYHDKSAGEFSVCFLLAK